MWYLYWIVTSLVALITWKFWSRGSNKNNGMPVRIPGALPIIGHALKITPEIYKKWQAQYGDFYTIKISGREAVVIHDANAAKVSLRVDDGTIGFSEIIEELLGFDRDIYKYASSCRADVLNPALKRSVFHQIQPSEPIIVDSCLKFIEKKFKESGKSEIVIDIEDFAKMIVGSTTGKYMFGLDLPDEFYKDCTKAESKQMKAFAILSLVWIRWIPFKRLVWRDYMNFATEIKTKYLRSLVAECRANPGRSILVDTLVNVSLENDKSGLGPVTDDEIAHVMLGLILASMTNTTILTTHVIASLMKNPDYCRRVKEEIAALPKADSLIQNRLSGTIPVLDAITYECARRAVITLGSFRLVLKDYEILNPDGEILYTVPAGNLILIPHASKNLNEKVFSNPEKFDPERFLTKTEQKSDVLNWGGGIHMCPGKNLALQEARVITATLLEHYDVKPQNLELYGNIKWHSAAGTAVSPLDGKNAIVISRR